MALKPTIFKATVNLVDMNRELYRSEKLTLALHPSETKTRMMVRLLAYALNFDEDIQFSKGLSATEEPDLWIIRPDQSIDCWIEVGQASPERLRKAVSRAAKVKLYAYGSDVDIWWQKQGEALAQLPKCEIYSFNAAEVEPLAQLCERHIEVTLTISESQIFVSGLDQQFEVNFQQLCR